MAHFPFIFKIFPLFPKMPETAYYLWNGSLISKCHYIKWMLHSTVRSEILDLSDRFSFSISSQYCFHSQHVTQTVLNFYRILALQLITPHTFWADVSTPLSGKAKSSFNTLWPGPLSFVRWHIWRPPADVNPLQVIIFFFLFFAWFPWSTFVVRVWCLIS